MDFMNPINLSEIITNHLKWLQDIGSGERADLSGAYLAEADLSGADLSRANLARANLAEAKLSGANLSEANLSGANLAWAYLEGADLSEAYLSGANLSMAKLSRAKLEGTLMPGIKNQEINSLSEAAKAVREWLSSDKWVQNAWIETPTGAYEGNCRACLHGAVSYIGQRYSAELARRLNSLGYTIAWNDEHGRTLQDVLSALHEIEKLG